MTTVATFLQNALSMLVEGSLVEVTAKVALILTVVFIHGFFVRLLVLGVHVMAQIDAKGTKGFVCWCKAFVFYLFNTDKLKTVYIRGGALTLKPVRLVSSHPGRPMHHE